MERRWGWTRQRGYRLIAAAEVVENLKMSPIGDISQPKNEGNARELARLEAAAEVVQTSK